MTHLWTAFAVSVIGLAWILAGSLVHKMLEIRRFGANVLIFWPVILVFSTVREWISWFKWRKKRRR